MTSSHAMNPAIEAIRMQWDAAAEGWDAQSPALGGWLCGPTRTLLKAAGVEPGDCALDVAAGAGGQTIAIAECIGPQGRIVATDLSPTLVERLRRNTVRAGFPAIEARVADAHARLPEADVFDVALCRLGLMLMAEPTQCLAAIHAALKPGGRFSAMVFAGPEDNLSKLSSIETQKISLDGLTKTTDLNAQLAPPDGVTVTNSSVTVHIEIKAKKKTASGTASP